MSPATVCPIWRMRWRRPIWAAMHLLRSIRCLTASPEMRGRHPCRRFRRRIDTCFGQDSLAAVIDALGAEASGWGREQLEQLSRKSPTSLAVTFRQLRQGVALDFDAAMQLEYRLVQRFMAGHDFREGVRALIIDKDNQPDWRPARLEDVTDAALDAYFAPLAEGDLQLGGGSDADTE